MGCKNLAEGGEKTIIIWRKEAGIQWREAGIWRRELGDIAKGAPQRALCDMWRREVAMRNQKSDGRKYEYAGGTWDMGISQSDVGGGTKDSGEVHQELGKGNAQV